MERRDGCEVVDFRRLLTTISAASDGEELWVRSKMGWPEGSIESSSGSRFSLSPSMPVASGDMWENPSLNSYPSSSPAPNLLA